MAHCGDMAVLSHEASRELDTLLNALVFTIRDVAFYSSDVYPLKLGVEYPEFPYFEVPTI